MKKNIIPAFLLIIAVISSSCEKIEESSPTTLNTSNTANISGRLFANLIIGRSSSDLPELLIIIKRSFFEMLPKSPCRQSFADSEKEGLPTEDIVDAIFDAINPLLPTPQRIIFDWQFTIALTALSKFLFKDFLNDFSALISKSITWLAIIFEFLFLVNETIYLP